MTPPISQPFPTEVVVIGSGAGGAATALVLAEHGYEVTLLEEGPDIDTSAMAPNSPDAIARLYRNGGLTPLLGNTTIAFVEGRCLGGSTEVNSAFWHRLPDDAYDRWRADALLDDFTPAALAPYFDRLERELTVSFLQTKDVPRSSALFRRGIEQLDWKYQEVPRCQKDSAAASQFAPGNKQSMQRTFLPRARALGVRILTSCRVDRLVHRDGRVTGLLARLDTDGRTTAVELRAEHVFVCAGATQTPALLRRSRITTNVGDNLRIHPMIKAAAVFDEPIGAHTEPLPIYQVKEFWPTITLGGSVFTPGFLAMLLAENWDAARGAMADWNRMALYYAGTRGMSRGTIRVVPGLPDAPLLRYRLTAADVQNLNHGLAYLGEVLFAAGARAVYPSVRSLPVLRSVDECRALRRHPVPAAAMALSTVHAFSSCPMGENPDLCATDSFGRVRGFRNLHVNDASLLPDSPGVNPQGTIMALAMRNADHFAASRTTGPRSRRSGASQPAPTALVTGAPGWLGTRLVEALATGLPDTPRFATPAPGERVRCLVHPAADPGALLGLGDAIDLASGELADPRSLDAFCAEAAGAVLYHVAGVVHPQRRTSEFTAVNVEGTRRLLHAAEHAGVRRVVVVSSNSPFGFNPRADHVFDEATPYNPYMGYGRSKAAMEALVLETHARGKLECVIIRPPWFYGPHQPARQTTFFQMIKTGRFPILGDGTQRRSMAYVDNICQGLLLAATVPQAAGQAYWIADERPYPVNEIVDTVQAVLTDIGIVCSPRRLRVPAVLGEIARVVDGAVQSVGLYNQQVHVLGEMGHTIACSIDKARTELGYAPAIGLREGMRRSVQWCLANGLRI